MYSIKDSLSTGSDIDYTDGISGYDIFGSNLLYQLNHHDSSRITKRITRFEGRPDLISEDLGVIQGGMDGLMLVANRLSARQLINGLEITIPSDSEYRDWI